MNTQTMIPVDTPEASSTPPVPPAPTAGAGSWRIIAVKELRELMVTGRFQAAAILVFSLLAITMAVATRNHARALEEYGIAESARMESLREDGHLNRSTSWTPSDPPSPLTMLVGGVAGGGNLGRLDIDGVAIAYPPADLIVVIGIILSLVAILFAHDAFTGERERGTLKLLVSGGASRSAVLGGKLVGRYAALLVPLLGGVLAGSLPLILSTDIGWGGTETGALVALVGVSMLFLAVFVALGLLVSAWSRTTHGSLGLALLGWGVFVLIVPAVAPYVAATLSPVDNLTLHQRRIDEMMDTERDDLVRELQREWRAPILQRHPQIRSYFDLPAADRPAARAADPALDAALARYEAVSDSAVQVANARQREKVGRLQEAFDARRDAQVRLTEGLASLSPYPALVLSGLDLTETGPRADARRREQGQAWGQATFRPWLYATMDSARAADPTVGWNSRIDLSGMPRFVYSPEPVPQRLAATLPQLGGLTGFLILFLLGGLVGIRRYDVR